MNTSARKCIEGNLPVLLTKSTPPVKSGTLYATAEEISNTRKISVYSIRITNEENELIATFQGTAYKKQ
jgi:acyl-CoA thioesterase